MGIYSEVPLMPLSINSVAMALPIPLVEPVTMAVCGLRGLVIFCSYFKQLCTINPIA